MTYSRVLRGAAALTLALGLSACSNVAGAPGTQGANGALGASGAPGATGPAGPQGLTGATGPAGLNGLNGTNGVDGAAGSSGQVGATGAIGSTGATGATGATGPAGASAITYFARYDGPEVTIDTGTVGLLPRKTLLQLNLPTGSYVVTFGGMVKNLSYCILSGGDVGGDALVGGTASGRQELIYTSGNGSWEGITKTSFVTLTNPGVLEMQCAGGASAKLMTAYMSVGSTQTTPVIVTTAP